MRVHSSPPPAQSTDKHDREPYAEVSQAISRVRRDPELRQLSS